MVTEGKTLARIKQQLSALDNQWIANVDATLTSKEYEAEFATMNKYARVIDEAEAIVEDELRKLTRELHDLKLADSNETKSG